MSRAFFEKELRDQRVFGWLGVGLFVVNDLIEVALGSPDTEPLGVNFSHLGGATAGAVLLVAFAVGTGLLAREADEGTLGFLDGLPLSRARIWAVKGVTAVAMLMVYPLLHAAFLVGLHLWSRGSLDHALHLHLVLQHLALLTLCVTVTVFAGMLLGFTRALAWAALAVVVSALTWASRQSPAAAAFDPTTLLEQHLVGATWHVPELNLGVQLSLAVFLGLGSLLAFMRTGRSSRSLDERLKRPVVSAIVALVTVCAVVLALYVVGGDSDGDDTHWGQTEDVAGAWFDEGPSGHAETEHYRFSYPAQRAQGLLLLLDAGDLQFEAVERALGGVDGGTQIPVDLWGSSRNTAGTAMHESIRMGLDSKEDLLGVLAHETTHVIAGRLANETKQDGLARMSIFNEGLASWVERRVAPGDGGQAELDRLQAAWVSRRRLVEPTVLTDADALTSQQDVSLQYPLGGAFVQALVDRHGPRAPAKVLETLGRDDFPRGLSGFELWTAAFQLAGYDVGAVFDDYSRLLKRWELERKDTLDALPRLRGVLTAREGWVGVEVLVDGEMPEGFTAVVRFRPAKDSALDTYFQRPVREDDLTAWVERREVGPSEVCFQPGLKARGVTIYEPWGCQPIDAARGE